MGLDEETAHHCSEAETLMESSVAHVGIEGCVVNGVLVS